MRKDVMLLLLASFIISLKSLAQDRFKAGLGVAYVSNTYEAPHLYDYFAPAINLSYSLLYRSRFELALESATTIISKENKAGRKLGFTTSLPLIASLNLNRVNLYLGSGPAYIRQLTESSRYYEKESGYYLNNLVGVAFKSKPDDKMVYTESHIRLSYLKSLSYPAYNGGMISFIFFIRG